MMPRPELKDLQCKLLKNLVNKLYDQSRFYRNRMESQGVTPDDIVGRLLDITPTKEDELTRDARFQKIFAS